MTVQFVNPKNYKTKEIGSFDWFMFFFNFLFGIPAFFRGFIVGGIFSFILSQIYYYNIFLLMEGRSPNAHNGIWITGLLILLYSLFLAVFGPRLRAYKLIKSGWHIKNADSKTVRTQLYKWKIGDSVIKNYSDNVDPVKNGSNLDELKKLGELLTAGIITEEEFNTKKKELLK